jgi:hypothetical protein
MYLSIYLDLAEQEGEAKGGEKAQ